MEDLGTVPNVQIITAVIAYDDPEAWHTYILFCHHAMCIPTMQRHLLNPNQMRANDVIVNETPLVLLPYDLRNKHSHSIVATVYPGFPFHLTPMSFALRVTNSP